MDYVTIFILYYLIGVVVIFLDWTRSLDFTIEVLVSTLLLWWMIWPFVVIVGLFFDDLIPCSLRTTRSKPDKVLFKKRESK